MKTIRIIVGPAGEVRLETKGFQGNACRDASRFLEHALGHTTGEQLTAEFHQAATAQQSAENRQHR